MDNTLRRPKNFSHLLGKHNKIGDALPSDMQLTDDRRVAQRFTSKHITTVIPLNADLIEIGDSISIIVEDISSTGVGIVSTVPLDANYLVVNLCAWHAVQDCLAEVVYCVPFGADNFRIGCRFLEHLLKQ